MGKFWGNCGEFLRIVGILGNFVNCPFAEASLLRTLSLSCNVLGPGGLRRLLSTIPARSIRSLELASVIGRHRDTGDTGDIGSDLGHYLQQVWGHSGTCGLLGTFGVLGMLGTLRTLGTSGTLRDNGGIEDIWGCWGHWRCWGH